MLFEGTGQTQEFDNGTGLTSSRFAPGADDLLHHIYIEIFDPLGGNPFGGGADPVTIEAFADGSSTPFLKYTRPDEFADNYISFVGEGGRRSRDKVVRMR